jgi:hypothetical protein
LSSFSFVLVVATNDPLGCCDLDLGGLSLASIAVIHNLHGCGLHVDPYFLSLPSCLQSSTNDLLSCCDLDFGGLSLAFLVLAFLVATCNPLGCSPHVGRRLPFLPFWL